MLSYFQYLKNPFIFALFFALLSIIVLFIDSKINGNDRDNKDYIKLFVYTISVILGSNWYLKSKKMSGGGHNNNHKHHDQEEVHIDNPNWN